MSKEIPYFKFFTGEWANGEITLESFEAQGVFINICCLYWSKEGKLKERFLERRFPKENIKELLDCGVIKIVEGFVKIGFLDEQLSECENIRLRNSNAGKASASKRKSNTRSTPVQQKTNTPSTNKKREEKRIEDKSKEEEVLKMFDETNWENVQRNFETTKEAIRKKLEEFVEIEKLTPTFKNKQIGEILKHFRNWLNYNPPKKQTRKQNTIAPWVKK
jgi:hypothetical protein